VKVETAQSVVDKEHTRLEYEEKQRANGMGELRVHVDRLGSIRALMEDNQLTTHVLCKEAMRQAEHACAVVGELFGKGPVSGAAPALEVAKRKVSDVHDMVIAEAQRRERNLAEKAHAANQLDDYRCSLQAVQDTHAALGMGDVAYVADSVNRAAQALREAELLVSAENVGLSLIGRATQRVQGLLEVAERSVGQQKRRQEELTRFKFQREEVTAHRSLRRDYKEKLKARAEQGERLRMNTELNSEASKMMVIMSRSDDDVTHASRLAELAVESARIAIDHALLPVAQKAVREAQVKIHYALHYARSAEMASGPAIAGRDLADSDLQSRRMHATNNGNNNGQQHPSLMMTEHGGGEEIGPGGMDSRGVSKSAERGLSLRRSASSMNRSSGVEAQEKREQLMQQLEANIMAGVGDRESQLRQLQDLQLPIMAARYETSTSSSAGGGSAPRPVFPPPAPGGGGEEGGGELEGGSAEDQALADYKSEQFYGGSQSERSAGAGGGGNDNDNAALDFAMMFPDFPEESSSMLKTYLTRGLFDQLAKLTTASGVTLQDCIVSGVEYPENPVGLFAGDSESLVLFEPLFEPVVSELHGLDLANGAGHPESPLDSEGVSELPKSEGGDDASGAVLGCRVKFSRNVSGKSLTTQMTPDQRQELVATIGAVFSAFEGTDFAATKYDLSDVHARQEVKSRVEHVAPVHGLPSNDNDAFKESAGIFHEWPLDRAVFVGDDDAFLAVVNGHEHLVVCTVHPDSLVEAFNTAADLLDNIKESEPMGGGGGLGFEYNSKFGYVTADLSQLGTAMECEVTVKAAGRLGTALKAGRLATTCSQATLEAVDVVPSEDGLSCTVKSLRTVGVSVSETLAAVTEAACALIEATKHE
jgi:creatine kinase